MGGAITYRECKKQIGKLPLKQQLKLAGAILDANYERECLEAAKKALCDYKAGKVEALPYEEVLAGMRAKAKSRGK